MLRHDSLVLALSFISFADHPRQAIQGLGVSTDRKIFRPHDLQEDPWEKAKLIDSNDDAHIAARDKFQAVISGMPKKDARPLYEPRDANPWDKRLKAGKK